MKWSEHCSRFSHVYPFSAQIILIWGIAEVIPVLEVYILNYLPCLNKVPLEISIRIFEQMTIAASFFLSLNGREDFVALNAATHIAGKGAPVSI